MAHVLRRREPRDVAWITGRWSVQRTGGRATPWNADLAPHCLPGCCCSSIRRPMRRHASFTTPRRGRPGPSEDTTWTPRHRHGGRHRGRARPRPWPRPRPRPQRPRRPAADVPDRADPRSRRSRASPRARSTCGSPGTGTGRGPVTLGLGALDVPGRDLEAAAPQGRGAHRPRAQPATHLDPRQLEVGRRASGSGFNGHWDYRVGGARWIHGHWDAAGRPAWPSWVPGALVAVAQRPSRLSPSALRPGRRPGGAPRAR